VNDGFLGSVVGEVAGLRRPANVGSFSSRTLPILLLPYAGVETPRC
jgi:hypothetical protein